MQRKPYEEFDRHSLESFQQAEKIPVTLVLDNIRSGLNIGSIFRTADAFRIQSIYLCGISATPPAREVLKSALGATESVSWKYSATTLECLKELKDRKVKLIGVEQLKESIALDHFTFPLQLSIALILGNEVNGVSEDCLPMLDSALEIPQFGTKHSFNVAISAGIVLWEYYRQLSGLT